jgi:hypothetical protein
MTPNSGEFKVSSVRNNKLVFAYMEWISKGAMKVGRSIK